MKIDKRIFKSPKLLLSSIISNGSRFSSNCNTSRIHDDETIHDRSELFHMIRKYNCNMKRIDTILNEKFNIIRNVKQKQK